LALNIIISFDFTILTTFGLIFGLIFGLAATIGFSSKRWANLLSFLIDGYNFASLIFSASFALYFFRA
jgi:hypothetical protein